MLIPLLSSDGLVWIRASSVVLLFAVPVTATVAVFGLGACRRAWNDAFSYDRVGVSAGISILVWQVFARSTTLAAVAVFALSLSAGLSAFPRSETTLRQALWCILLGLVGLTLARALAEVLHKLSRLPLPGLRFELDEAYCNYFGLTSREREVATLILQGDSYREASKRLFVSPATVKSHMLAVYEKTGCGNKIDLLRSIQKAR